MSLTDDILMHYGMPRRSGRYPWGSGDNPYQHSGDFLSRVEELKKSNFTFTDKDGKTYTGEVAIAKSMGLSTTQFRTQMSLAKDERRSADVATAKALRAKGYSLNEIADKMGFANDSSVRSLLNESSEARMNQAKQTAEFLKKQISEKGMIDVGTGVERELGISKEKMNQALYILEMEGYPIYVGGVPQVTNPGKQTNIKVLCPPGTEHKEIYNFENVHSVRDYVSHDDGETFDKFVYPKSMDSSRLKIRYAEDGGIQKDGVIEIRRGVDDLSLGDSHYAQVRILVDGNRYLKGMAVYSDDLPDGVDVMFNTNKKKGTPTSDVLKKVKDDPDNPFGSLIKAGGQSYYIDADGKRQLSLINKRAEEGDWGEWADKLPSQFLSKQSLSLVNKQLNLAASDKMAEFDEICSLTNPTVKKSLLKSFADDCDSAAVHLQAAALPRQKYQVILPITSMKDNEVYAPNYKNGETVALVRYPHGGTFEIPILTVNNKQAEARRILGNTPKDAIGINSKVAERLSGADFDGDTVMVIPCNSGKSKVKITSTPPLKGLEGFDPKLEYGGKPAGTFKPFGAIAVGITKFVGTFRKAIEDIGSFKESFIGILDSVRGCFEAYQNQLQAGTLLKIASAIAILTASLIALSLVDSEKLNVALGAITVLFADLLASMAVFNKISGQVTGVVKSVTAMLGIATAVLILASALKKIADLDAKQLTTGLIGVAGLTTMMVAAAKAMSSNSKAIIKGATQMVIFAAAIKILASVCEQLAKLDWNQLAKGLVGVGVLLAEVSLFLRTAKFSGKSITTATGIVILSASIKVLASACKDFGEMKWEDIGKGLASIAVLLAEITAFTKLTGNAQNVISTGVALIAIATAMKILASAVKDFSTMQWDEIARGLTAMAGALAAITVAVKFMPNNMAGIGAGLVIVAAALVVLSTALEKMGNLSWEQVAKGLITLGGAMAILAIGLNAMTGTLAGSAALLVAASALLVLTPVLTILGAMSWSSIVKGLVTLAGAFAILGVAGAVLTPLVPSILALSGSLALIGVAVVGIGAGLALAGAGLSALAVGLTALAAAGTAGATAIVASLTVIITGVAGLIPAIVAKIGEAIVEFCKVIADSAGAIGEAVKAVILMLVDVLVECVPAIADGALKLIAGVLEALVEYTPSIVDSIFQFLIAVLEGVAKNLPSLIQAAVDVLMAFFSGIVDALKGIDTETLLQGIVGIGLLAAIMAALSAVAALVPGAMLGVLGMGAVIAELALVLAAVGALAQIPGLNWLINEGGNLLQGIGTAIGKFVGGIVGGFMSGVSSQFPQIGSDLSGFMTNVQPFLDGAASIDPAMLDGVKALAETILILTAANILDGLTSWFTGGSSLSGFAEEMVPFGKAMKQFSDEISGIDGEAVSNAAIAGKTLAEMADTLPNTGGVVGFFAGENDMNAFGEQLIPFGRAMRNFANEVAGIDASVITEAATAGKALAEMASTVPNSGGVVGFFAGENDMDDFGEQLVPFGRAMKNFSDAVSGLKADVIQNSVTAGQALLELANTVPNTGGVVSWFTGDNDLETFGEQLVPFGTAMKNYSLAVTGLDASVVTNSANAAKALVELSNNLPNSGGIVSWFTGDNDIASFGEQLVSFGQSFAAYYNSVSGVDVAKLSGVVVEFRNLVDLANGIKSVDTSGMSTFAQNLTNLGNAGIDGFINAFTNANSRVSTAANTMITTFINAAKAQQGNLTSTFSTMINGIVATFTSKYSQFTIMGQTMMTNFISGIRTGDASARSAFVTIVSGCLTAIRNKFYEFNTVGQTTMTNLIAGVRTKNQLAKDAFVQIINSCLTAIRNKYTDFYNAGKYLVEGFAAGITANTYMAEARARAMARAAAQAAEAELDINSPSKVGYRIGGFFGMGFVNSLIDYTDKSYDAGASVAKSAKEGLRNAVSKISDFIENGIDSQPTIRPLLDLSDVTEGVGRLSALLSRNQAMKISAGMEREGASVVQNGGATPASGNNYNFTQNNYSPKALSRIDIYRQTKNQFSALKGLVET